MRIVADVGGTNARFALAQGQALSHLRSIPVSAFGSFIDALRHYRDGCDTADAPCGMAIGVAGPVEDERASLTNAGWTFHAGALSAEIGGAPVRIVNDLEAVALALPSLTAGDVRRLEGFSLPVMGTQPMLAVNVGTGFGAATLIPSAGGWIALPGEAGHMALSLGSNAPGLAGMPVRTVEELVSGPGIAAAYAWASGGAPLLSTAQVLAKAESDPVAAALIDEISAVLGRVAGDLVLATGSWGGVFLCGGVMSSWLRRGNAGRFRQAFIDKGAMAARMATVPCCVITRPDPALLGLAEAPLLPSKL